VKGSGDLKTTGANTLGAGRWNGAHLLERNRKQALRACGAQRAPVVGTIFTRPRFAPKATKELGLGANGFQAQTGRVFWEQ